MDTEHSASRFLDVRDLPAPEPLFQILRLAATLTPGERLIVHHNRVPCLLYARLAERGLQVVTEQPSPEWVVLTIQCATPK
ncbi:MAG: DUF2249 domain-containing protein [Magnetococcales bacterium]|nr:DUF2249 domain-containing protein [Magnetococcales bacterium]MBF0321717.1 DUF2249 domain-containing protein [Magnetococcales bacterium]